MAVGIAALGVRPGEGRTVGLLVAHSFCTGLARVLLLSAAGAIFLDSQSVEALPRMYLLLGLAGAAVGVLVGRAEAILRFDRFLSALLLGACGVTLALWGALAVVESAWLPVALGAWSYAAETVLMLVAGALVGRVFDLRQMKRLGALVGSGQTVAEIAGGLAVAALVGTTGARALLPVACAALLVGLVLTLRLARGPLAVDAPEHAADGASRTASPSSHPSRLPPGGAGAEPPSPRPHSHDGRGPALLSRPYVRLLVLLVLFDTILYYVLDAAFWAEAQARFGDGEALAAFFGLAFAAVSAVTLVVRTLVAAPLIARWGIGLGLAALPLVALPGALAVVAAGALLPGAAAVFWLFAAARLSYDVTYDAMYYPTSQVLFDALPPRERLAAFSFAETVAKPIAAALAGLLLMGLAAVAPIGAVAVAPLGLALGVGLLGLVVAARRGYVALLRGSLQKRLIGRGAEALDDATSRAVLEQGLLDLHPGVALFSLQRLDRAAGWDAGPWLVRLLDHPAAEVRAEALRRIESGRDAAAVTAVRALADADPAPVVRAAALRALLAASEGDAADEVAAYLTHADPRLRRGALVGLVLHGGIAGMVAAGQQLMALAASPWAPERRLLAEALGEIGARQLHRLLEPLLEDSDAGVRRAALHAAGEIASPALWPAVVRALGEPAVREAAAAALVAGGAGALPALGAVLDAAADPDTPDTFPGVTLLAPDLHRDLQRRAVAVAARIKEPAALDLLAGRIAHPDLLVRHALLGALSARGYRAAGGLAEAARQQLAAELGAAAWSLAALVDLAESHAADWVLRSALELEVARARERALWLLGLLDGRQAVLDAVRALAGGADGQAEAAEVLDALVDSPFKGAVLALVEPGEADERLARMGAGFAQPRLGADQRLRAVVERSATWLSPWTRACAVATGAQLGQRVWRVALAEAAESAEPLVRETAAWSLPWAGLDAAGWATVRRLRADPEPRVAGMAAYVAEVA